MNRKEVLFPIENAYRSYRCIDGIWHYAFTTQEGESLQHGFPKDKTIAVPGNYVDMLYHEDDSEFVGTIWYEKEEYIDKSWLGKEIFLRFDAMAHIFSLYINGINIVNQQDGYLPVVIDVAKYLRYGEMNTIVVKVNNEVSALTVPQGSTVRDKEGRTMNILDVRAPRLGGILGSVYLYTVPSYRITDYYMETKSITPSEAKVQYAVTVHGNCVATVTIRDKEGKVVATGVGGEGELTITNPQVWSRDNTYTYTAEIEVSRLGKQCDAYTTDFIIRTWDIEEGMVSINSVPTMIAACYYPNEQEKLHSAVFAKRFFLAAKAKGYNTIAFHAQMPTEAIIDMAAKEGLLLIGEIPTLAVDEMEKNHYRGLDKLTPMPLFHMGRMTKDCKYGSMLGWSLPIPTSLEAAPEDKRQRYISTLIEQLNTYDKVVRVVAFSTSVDHPYVPEELAKDLAFCWIEEEPSALMYMGARERLYRFEKAVAAVVKVAPQCRIFLSWKEVNNDKVDTAQMQERMIAFAKAQPSVVGYAVEGYKI